MTGRFDLSIGQRLSIGFGVVLLLLLLLAGFVAVENRRVNALEHRITRILDPRTDAAHEFQVAVLRHAVAARAYVVARTREASEEYGRAAETMRVSLARLAEVPKDPDGLSKFAGIPGLANRLDADLAELVTAAGRSVDRSTLRELEERAGEIRSELLRHVDDYVSLQVSKRQDLREKILASRVVSQRAFAVLLLLILAVGFSTALTTVNAVRIPALRLVKVTRALEQGDYGQALSLAGQSASRTRRRDELLELAGAVGRMADALQRREQRLEADARVSAVLAGSIDLERLTETALAQVAELAGCECAVLYLREPADGLLRRAAAYAADGAAAVLQPGEGIPGQALVSGKTLLVRDIPPTTPFEVRFGVDRVPPRSIAAVPLRFQERGVGVMVLASLRDLDAEQVAFLEQSARGLSVSLQNALAHRELHRLALELQERAEELAAQNEELEAQSEEIQAQNEELQAQSEEIQAQNEELQRRAQELAEMDRQKDQFLAMLGHELRNPLAAISSAAAVLREGGPDTPAWQRALTVVERQLRHQSRLVDELLDVSRVNLGKIELQCETVDLARLVAETVDDFRRGAQESDLTVELELPGSPLWSRGDGTRLSQCLVNLLSNAAKYTDGGGFIRVRLAADRNAEWAMLTVTDTGIGIDPELLPRVWEPFVQEDRTLDRSRGGLGLGLSLVKALVELHGGRVYAHSDGLGHGAEFRLELPLLPESQWPANFGAGTSVASRPLRVLVIEDNADAADSIRDLLELAGHEVELARTGTAGLEAARKRVPDVVLCDIGLPGIDGYEVARSLRAESATAHVRLIALSGYGDPSARTRCLEAGFDLHLVKPVDPDRLQRLLVEPSS
jgi:signal transduction histidine kinase/CHASE3 domain sensor protein